MPSWLIKAAVQGGLSAVPGGQRANRWLQNMWRTLGREFFTVKLDLCQRHLEHLFEIGQHPPDTPYEVLELGTGRVPLVPLGLAISGARCVTTFDRVPLLDPHLTKRACGFLLDEVRHGRLQQRLRWISAERIDLLQQIYRQFDDIPIAQNLGRLGIEVRVGDIRRYQRLGQGLDLIVSNNTLEHIASRVLREIFKTFREVATPDTIMSHFIDMVDHYARFDHRLTPYNFLRHHSMFWWLVNNSLQFQNRWRVNDYRMLHAEVGFQILFEETDDSASESLRAIPLAAEFRGYKRRDLAVTSSWMVSRIN
jgi:hypothetical protein